MNRTITSRLPAAIASIAITWSLLSAVVAQAEPAVPGSLLARASSVTPVH